MGQQKQDCSNHTSVTDIIEDFKTKAESDPEFVALLEASLNAANEAADKGGLQPDLYAALFWPINLLEYGLYLDDFRKWMPQQSPLPAWKNPKDGTSQEVYDRLCHFYFLIDQPVGPDEIRVQNIDWFAQFLVAYANIWGDFLNTSDSFNDDILQSFITDSPRYRVQDSMIDGKPNKPGGWQTFNEFFSRELNPGLRPIASSEDNSVITAPADCTYRMQYPISADSTIETVTVKKTHSFQEISVLLDGSPYSDAFANGTFVHYFLGPYSYHRFHTPVAGEMKECRAVQGLTYLQVNIEGNQFDAPDNSSGGPEGGYEFRQARGIVTIDTTNSPYGDMGIVAVIPVGMCQVSSVNMTGCLGSVNKGDEFGYFLFGGSDIILLFQEGKNPVIDTCSNYRYYGTNISICPPPIDDLMYKLRPAD